MLTTPNGQPLGQKNVSVPGEHVVAVTHALIDAQFARMMGLGVPPLIVVDFLIDILSNVLAGLEPATERGELVRNVAKKIEKAVAQKAGARMMNQAVPPSLSR